MSTPVFNVVALLAYIPFQTGSHTLDEDDSCDYDKNIIISYLSTQKRAQNNLNIKKLNYKY